MRSIHLAALLAAAVASAARAELRPAAMDTVLSVGDYLDYEQVGGPQISPDGKTIAFTRSWVDKINDQWESAIWVMNADGSHARFLVKGGNPLWSPDGTRLAYVAMA